MKYMHLNSSCPYAGLANMLMLQGHDTEDFKIALAIDLPSHIRYDSESGAFLSGFSLQSKKWFDLYLNPIGFTYIEQFWAKEELPKRLLPGMMLGLFIAPEQKHAVICSHADETHSVFINNKWAHTGEPETFRFTGAELQSRLPDTVAVGWLQSSAPQSVDFEHDYKESLETWLLLQEALHKFMSYRQSASAMRKQLNPLFRPLLLDGLTMAQLRGEKELTAELTTLQKTLLNVLRQNTPARLADHMDMGSLDRSIQLIMQHGTDAADKLLKNAR